MCKKALLLAPILAIGLLCQAQKRTPDIELPQMGVKAAYLGSLLYPGFKIGIERPYKVIRIEKKQPGIARVVQKERYWCASLGFYHHKTFHDNFYLLVERQKRRQKMNGWFIEIAPGLGYSRTFLSGATYVVGDDGVVKKKPLAGHNYAMASFSFGSGYNFLTKKNLPLRAYGKASWLAMLPYNTSIYMRPSIELGIIYTPNGFWTASPTVKIKKQ